MREKMYFFEPFCNPENVNSNLKNVIDPKIFSLLAFSAEVYHFLINLLQLSNFFAEFPLSTRSGDFMLAIFPQMKQIDKNSFYIEGEKEDCSQIFSL